MCGGGRYLLSVERLTIALNYKLRWWLYQRNFTQKSILLNSTSIANPNDRRVCMYLWLTLMYTRMYYIHGNSRVKWRIEWNSGESRISLSISCNYMYQSPLLHTCTWLGSNSDLRYSDPTHHTPYTSSLTEFKHAPTIATMTVHVTVSC